MGAGAGAVAGSKFEDVVQRIESLEEDKLKYSRAIDDLKKQILDLKQETLAEEIKNFKRERKYQDQINKLEEEVKGLKAQLEYKDLEISNVKSRLSESITETPEQNDPLGENGEHQKESLSARAAQAAVTKQNTSSSKHTNNTDNNKTKKGSNTHSNSTNDKADWKPFFSVIKHK